MGNQIIGSQDSNNITNSSYYSIGEDNGSKNLIQNNFSGRFSLQQNSQQDTNNNSSQKAKKNQKRFDFIKCIPNVNCFDSQKIKGQSQWQRHLRYMALIEYKEYEWAQYIYEKAIETTNKTIDNLNQKQVLKVAMCSKIEAEEQIQAGISEQDIDNFIYQLLENTEILTEILQEYRYVPKIVHQDCNLKEKLTLKNKNIAIYKNAFQYKATIKCIEDQIKDNQNPLYQIREDFITKFIQQKKNNNLHSTENSQQQEFESMMEEIKIFINFYIEVLRVYYLLDEIAISSNPAGSELDSFINIENLTNFVTSILFQHDNFFHLVFKFTQGLESKLQFNFQKNLKLLKDPSPEFFNISEEFCLNDKTLSYIYRVLNNNQNKNEQQNKNGNDEIQQLQNRIFINKPYQKSLDIMAQLEQTREPIKMLKIFIDTSESIKQCIEEFYKFETNISVNQSNEEREFQRQQLLAKCYDGDHFLSIFLYFVVQTQIQDLFAYLNIIQSFVYRNTYNSISGYLLITIEGCVHHIADFYKNQHSTEK